MPAVRTVPRIPANPDPDSSPALMISALNQWGSQLIPAGASLLAQSAILVILLLLMEVTIGRRLKATLRCALWLLILFKLALPPSLKLPTGLGFWLGPYLIPPLSTAPAPVSPDLAWESPSAVPFESAPAFEEKFPPPFTTGTARPLEATIDAIDPLDEDSQLSPAGRRS